MKYSLTVILLSFFFVTTVICQVEKIEKFDESSSNQIFKIDVAPFLEKYNKKVTNFLKENPNYFENSKLSKINGWNFSVGSTKNWKALNLKTNQFYSVPSTCRAIGTNCYIFVEDAIWNSRVVQENVNAIKESFDNSTPASTSKGIYETVVESFGNPPDIDNDEKIIILVLDIIDNYDSTNGFVAGYFHSLNEIHDPNSNLAEIYYLDANPADLSTEAGLENVMNTTAHEFQHMVHFNYHNGTAIKPAQTTFLNEGCSLVSEVICGFQIYNQSYFNNEPNQYLLNWRSGDEVLSDYSRAARFTTYLYEQFGTDYLNKFVQSRFSGIAGIEDALNNLSNPTDLNLEQILNNWFIANTVNDKSINQAWGYFTNNIGNTEGIKHANPNYTSTTNTAERAASNYITYFGGKNLSIEFNDLGSNKLTFKAIKYNINGNVEIQDINSNTQYTFRNFGTIYNTITFSIMNNNLDNSYEYSYSSSGEANIVTLAYDENLPTGVLGLSDKDTVCVVFDGVPDGNLDSIKVALRQAGSIHGGIYEYSGSSRPTPLGKELLSNLTVTSTISEKPSYPYPEPWTNWINVDLTESNISSAKSFVAAFEVEGTYPENNRIMITEQPNGTIHSYTYLNNPSSEIPAWYYISSSADSVYDYLIRAYISFGITDVEHQIVELHPQEFMLNQNYPNPFNPSTVINYSIKNSGYVTLKVYNINGEIVSTLVSKNQPVGNYKINFDASSLASGTYIYELKNNNNRIAKKMLLIK